MTALVEHLVAQIGGLTPPELLELKVRLARQWGNDDAPGAGVREPRKPIPPTGQAAQELYFEYRRGEGPPAPPLIGP